MSCPNARIILNQSLQYSVHSILYIFLTYFNQVWCCHDCSVEQKIILECVWMRKASWAERDDNKRGLVDLSSLYMIEDQILNPASHRSDKINMFVMFICTFYGFKSSALVYVLKYFLIQMIKKKILTVLAWCFLMSLLWNEPFLNHLNLQNWKCKTKPMYL